jgi:hypothetical protein
MNTELDPIVGTWYKHAGKGNLFRVVAIDEERDSIQIQHFDGDLGQIELSGWLDLDVEVTEAPEDTTGPVDDVETDDLGYSETAMRDADWQAPLESNPSAAEEWEDEQPEEERDEWDEGESSEELYGSEP